MLEATTIDYFIGHDYLGRSAAPSTLQVNTHTMKDMTYVAEFVPQGSSAVPVPALTIGAGAQLNESMYLSSRGVSSLRPNWFFSVYAYTEAMNISAVLGACTTVGAGALLYFLVRMDDPRTICQLAAIYRAADTECKYLEFDPARAITSFQG